MGPHETSSVTLPPKEWQRRDGADVVRFKFVVRGANGSLRWEVLHYTMIGYHLSVI